MGVEVGRTLPSLAGPPPGGLQSALQTQLPPRVEQERRRRARRMPNGRLAGAPCRATNTRPGFGRTWRGPAPGGLSVPRVLPRPRVRGVDLVGFEVAFRRFELGQLRVLFLEGLPDAFDAPFARPIIGHLVPEGAANAVATGRRGVLSLLQIRELEHARVLVAPYAVLGACRLAVATALQRKRVPHTIRRRRVHVGERPLLVEAVATQNEAEPVVDEGAVCLPRALVAREATAFALALVVGEARTEVHPGLIEDLVGNPHLDLEAVQLRYVESIGTAGSAGINRCDFILQVPHHAREVRGVDLPQAHGVEHSGPSGAVHVELQNRLVRRYLREGGLLDVDGVVRPLLPALHPLALVEEDLLAEPTIGVAHAVAMDEAGA
mmetsp:Transcript_112367/g.220268  ORF Transcript_112367/g.220268 Transcript_112367/m.220268 type:complete len:379 (+) Transcript_112367:157-1293(+)